MSGSGTTSEQPLKSLWDAPQIATPTSVPIFKKFRTKQKLTNGAYLIRSLGGGQYEIIEAKNADAQKLGSEDAGRQISTVPGRLPFLERCHSELQGFDYNVSQGIASAKLNIFRFLKLPVELRLRIYELIFVCDKPLKRRYYGKGLGNKRFSLSLVCKQIYQESNSIFYSNSFMLQTPYEDASQEIPHGVALEARVKSLICVWGVSPRDGGNSNKSFFNSVAKFPRLENLTIKVLQQGRHLLKSETLYQNDDSIKKFSRIAGFDSLVGVRGLKTVFVELQHWGVTTGRPSRDIPRPSDEEVETFQTFLRNLLTQPKAQPEVEDSDEVATPVKSKSKGKGKRGKAAAKRKGRNEP